MVFSLNFCEQFNNHIARRGRRGRAQQSSGRRRRPRLPSRDPGRQRDQARASLQNRPCGTRPPRATSPQRTRPPEPHLPPHAALKPLSPRAAGASGSLSGAPVPGGTQRSLWGRPLRSHTAGPVRKGALVAPAFPPAGNSTSSESSLMSGSQWSRVRRVCTLTTCTPVHSGRGRHLLPDERRPVGSGEACLHAHHLHTPVYTERGGTSPARGSAPPPHTPLLP